MRLGSVVTLIFAIALASAPASGARSLRVASPGAEWVPGEVVVLYEPGTTAEDRRRARGESGVRAERRLRLERAALVRVDDETSVAEAVARLRRSPAVRSAEPNYRMRAHATTPDDPLFVADRLWGLHNGTAAAALYGGVVDADIDAPEAWDTSTGASDVTVAVVDEGVQHQHPDLAGHMWVNAGEVAGNGVDDDGNGFVDDRRGWDFIGDDGEPMDEGGHGTHVAGTIGAIGDNAVGLAGVSWNARLMPVRALGPDGGTDVEVGDAFDYAGDNGADIVNASLGRDGELSGYQEAVIAAHPDVLFVFAAGNGGDDGVGDDVATVGSAPCASPQPNVICVGATDPADALSTFSNFGTAAVDLAAPGEAILSTAIFSEPFADDFEDGLLEDQWGSVGFALAEDSYGGFVHAEAADASLTTLEPVDVTGRSGCRLEFAAYLDAQGPSSGVLERSGDDGAWVSVNSLPETGSWRWTAPAISGSHRYRFRLDYDGAGPDLLALDDVAVRCPGVDAATSYTYSSGTSMATPHVSGAAAVLLSLDPGATPAHLRSVLMATGDAKASLSRRTVSGRRLNLHRAVQEISAPIASTGAAVDVTSSSARLTGAVEANGVETHYQFEYGPVGALSGATAASSVGSGGAAVAVAAEIGGLTPDTVYEYRLVAVRGAQRFPGGIQAFTTRAASSSSDASAGPAPTSSSTPAPAPAEDPVRRMEASAKVTCRRRARGRVACRFRADGARSVRGTVKDARRRLVGRFRARTGRRALIRIRGLRRQARYTFTMTFTDAQGNRARVRKRLKIR